MMGNIKLMMGALCMAAIVSVAPAAEVIGIDFNNHGNTVAYSGEAAVEGATHWVAFYGGWGVPIGSPRSSNLAYADAQDIRASVYAAQVWLGDLGEHGYVEDEEDPTTLLDDGFVIDTSKSNDPFVEFIGLDTFGDAGENHAYGGTFDLYVYGNSAGAFTLKGEDGVELRSAQSVTGTTSGFVEGENYVVFSAVEIAAPNAVRLHYTNELNGIQLVSKKVPYTVVADANDITTIDATEYHVAYDTNARSGEQTLFGPDLESYVHYIDQGEYMIYDINVGPGDAGEYLISADVVTRWGAADLSIYANGRPYGMITRAESGTEDVLETDAVTVKLFEGRNTVRWLASTGNVYFDLANLKIEYSGPITFADCDEIYEYGLNLPGDLNRDCRVDLLDLAILASEWTQDYN